MIYCIIFGTNHLFVFAVKLPKEFDPKVDPDPERWIPRKERSTYRGRKRDKRREIGKHTQVLVYH